MKLPKSTKKFVKRWASYPLRSLMYRHSKKIILVLLAVIAALLMLVLKPEAAGVTVEANTDALNDVAAAISSNAQVINDYADSIDISEVSSMAADVNQLVDAAIGGMPMIVVAVIIFAVAVIVFRKVIGR